MLVAAGLSTAAVGALIAAAAAPAVTWLLGRRARSGRVGTSDPGELWGAMDSFQKNLMAELGAHRLEIKALRELEESCQERCRLLQVDNEQLAARVAKLEESRG